MEKRQLRRSASATDEWIKCPSKQRPGMYYLFNKKTGETKWCTDTRSDTKPPKTISPPKWTITKSSLRTPAQDRLKRLQSKLQSKVSKEKLALKQEIKQRNRSNHEISTNLKKENIDKNAKIVATASRDAMPSTSASAMAVKKESPSTSLATTMLSKTPSKLKANSSKKSLIKLPPKKESQKRPSTSSLVAPDSPAKLSKRAKSDFTQTTAKTDEEEDPEERHVYPCTTTAISLGSGIVNKIKEICKCTINTYQNAKKALGQRSLEPCIKNNYMKKDLVQSNNNNSTHLMQDALLQMQKGQEERQQVVTSSTPLAIVVKATAVPNDPQGVMDFKAIALTTSPNQRFGTTKPFLPSYDRGSANARLERLRLSLQEQATADSNLLNTPSAKLRESTYSSGLTCVINKGETTEQQSYDNEIEAMDWAPVEDIKPIEIKSSDISNTFCTEVRQDTETVGEYYGTVNENLLRFAVEQKQDEKVISNKWLKGHYYFVLDTNVLLQHLTFIEDLSHMKLCDTNGTMLYVPYSVLQELDKLKQFATGDGTKVLAVRAIKYLNSKFESKDKHLQAQSALSELEHLIEVSSPDDRIINCCLQVKQQIDHVILLTEDINLRNKAICNNILVSTKSDLISKRF